MMAELSCRCLNVTIHLDNNEVQLGSPMKPSDLLINMKKASQFEDLYEVKPGVAGINVIHNCLVQSYQSGDWIIHKCANCGIDTHVTHRVKGDNKMFTTDKMETDAAKIEELRRNENFSTVFKVTLSDAPKDETVEQQRVFAMSLGNNDPAVKQLHQHMKTFLNEEEAALEERIMAFEKEQREAFSRLCNKAHKERGLIFRSLAKAKTSETATEEGTSQQDKGQANMELITKPGPSLIMGQRNQSLSSSNNSSNSSSPGRQPEVTIMLQDKPIGNKSQGMLSKEDGFEDALFGMDGIDGDDRATHFIQSDDDDESTSTDDSYREELTHSSQSVNVAQSLPITVPLYSTYTSRPQPSEHRDEKIHIAPSQMAESIKALALSVHQETEIFGDLPKPRTNSCTWAR